MKSGPKAKSLEERFWPKVNKEGPVVVAELGKCWVWAASTYSNGYGQIGVGTWNKPKNALAHRIAYELTFGTISNDDLVLHKCNNKSCVNPAHLYLGNKSDNARDMMHHLGDDFRQHQAKLTREQATELRRLAKSSEMSQGQLGDRFGISQSAVSKILLNLSWPE